MKKFIIICFLLSACNSKDADIRVKEATQAYEIICKHPLGHIERFKVSQSEFDIPTNFRGGIWSFETIEGYKIRSTNCHADSRSIQMEH